MLTFGRVLNRLNHAASLSQFPFLPILSNFSAGIPRVNFTLRYHSAASTQTIEKMVKDLSPSEIACLQRLRTGAMSFGSIGEPAHTTIAEAVNRIAKAIHGRPILESLSLLPAHAGPMSNSGEGGEVATRDKHITQSRIRQVASARFGVTGRYLAHADIIEIKVNQGAKPGVGGELPAEKVTVSIAAARSTQAHVRLVSPPPHHDIYSIEDLKQLIHDLRSANPKAQISVKLAASYGIGIIAAGVAKCGADIISIAGPGGTGATPITAKYEFVHAWESALAEAHQCLIREGLRPSVQLVVSGGLQTSTDLMKALLLGADYLEMGSSILVSLGCVMAEVCHKGNCPTGIATTDEKLIAEKFKGKPEDVARYLIETAKRLNRYLRKFGFNDPSQAVGRTDLLEVRANAPMTGLEQLLTRPENPYNAFSTVKKSTGSSYLESTLIARIRAGEHDFTVPADNRDRSFGARMNYFAVTDPAFQTQLQQHTITVRFEGIAPGQSFGCLLGKNIKLVVENSNDGTAKMLDGGRVYVRHTAGNQTAYGATQGEFFASHVGDRAFIRNSGCNAAVETVGQMAANFMTGGSLIIWGGEQFYSFTQSSKTTKTKPETKLPVGPNLGAGMSGGKIILPKILYTALSTQNHIAKSIAKVEARPLTADEAAFVLTQAQHYREEIPGFLDGFFNKSDKPIELTEDMVVIDPIAEQGNVLLFHREFSDDGEDIWLPEINRERAAEKSRAKPQTRTSALNIEKDACGVATIVSKTAQASREAVEHALTILARLQHRGATGIDPKTGDGCGMVLFGLHSFFAKRFPQLTLQPEQYGIVVCAIPKKMNHQTVQTQLKQQLADFNLTITDQRIVPTNLTYLGLIAAQQDYQLIQYIILRPKELSLDEFERCLVKTRLRFDLSYPNDSQNPNIVSASAHHVIYKALVPENAFGQFFVDFQQADFMIDSAVIHARFATNTLPQFRNIQPLPNLANNGENNNIVLITRILLESPLLKSLLKMESFNFDNLSDSRILSIALDTLWLSGCTPEMIVNLTIQAYQPNPTQQSEVFHNLFGLPFEGPNASVLVFGRCLYVLRDKNGFRPQRLLENDHWLYTGSELGPFTQPGKTSHLRPATPIVINLQENQRQLQKVNNKNSSLANKYQQGLRRLSGKEQKIPILEFTEKAFELRKLQAGWTQEYDKMIMQPLMNLGQGTIVSMGDQGPIEALVRGANLDFSNFLKGQFSQVTNPPLAKNEEAPYLSLLTFVGVKPDYARIYQQQPDGFVLDSPIVDNQQLAELISYQPFQARVLTCTFPVLEREAGLQAALTAVRTQSLQAANEGCQLIVLSDVFLSEERAPIPAVLISSIVDNALQEAGLRNRVSLVVQSSQVLSGAHVAQCISVGGADCVNPYLAFVKDSTLSDAKFKRTRDNYKHSLGQELLGFMARMGISTVQAYRGTKGFYGYGLDEDLASMLGIQCNFGGVNCQDLSRMVLTRFRNCQPMGYGKYDHQGQPSRQKNWNTESTLATIKLARGQEVDYDHVEKRLNVLKLGQPRGWLRLKTPQHWSDQNPMTICIMGGGAAGFFQAQSLLETDLPIRIVMIEKSHGNKFGLLGDGVAPDHQSTKNQARVLRELLADPRFHYYGGIEIGAKVTLEHLLNTYPCVIDCRGASKVRKLGIPGEDIPGVVTDMAVYYAYNKQFKPLTRHHHWPFTLKSKNPVLGIIGSGNVAADLARIFLKDADDLTETNIDETFLDFHRFEGPSTVRIFSRSTPWECKISQKELEGLEKCNLWICAHYPEGTPPKNLTADQQKIVNFFKKYANNSTQPGDRKKLYFHFQLTPKAFRQTRSEVECEFMDGHGQTQLYRASNYITALGRVHEPPTHPDLFVSGWAKGEGGTLASAQKSADDTTIKVRDKFLMGGFNRFTPIPPQAWMLRSSVGNAEFGNILNWMEDGHRFETIEEFRQARVYSRANAASTETLGSIDSPQTTPPADAAINATANATKPSIKTTPNAVTVISDDPNSPTIVPIPAGNASLLSLLQTTLGDKAPDAECGGEKVCGTCVATVMSDSPTLFKGDKKEKAVLRGAGVKDPKAILTCDHDAKEADNALIDVRCKK